MLHDGGAPGQIDDLTSAFRQLSNKITLA